MNGIRCHRPFWRLGGGSSCHVWGCADTVAGRFCVLVCRLFPDPILDLLDHALPLCLTHAILHSVKPQIDSRMTIVSCASLLRVWCVPYACRVHVLSVPSISICFGSHVIQNEIPQIATRSNKLRYGSHLHDLTPNSPKKTHHVLYNSYTQGYNQKTANSAIPPTCNSSRQCRSRPT